MDPEVLREALKKEMIRRYPGLPEEEAEGFLGEASDAWDTALPDMRDRMVKVKQEAPLQEQYQHSVRKISSRDPLLATSLSSNQALDSVLNQVDNVMQSTMPDYDAHDTEDGLEDNQWNDEIEKARRILAERIVEELESDLSTVARKAGWITWVRTKWKLFWIKRRRRMLSPDSEVQAPSGILISLLERYLKKEHPDVYEELQNYRRFSSKLLQNLWVLASRLWPLKFLLRR